jgi:NO-binding membrane sensor protein with MHYT domain
MDLQVVWSGSLERAAIVAQQLPAPRLMPVFDPRATLISLVLGVMRAPENRGRHWTQRELVAHVQRQRTSVSTATRKLVASGLVVVHYTGMSTQKGAAMRFALAE